ncbi:MAG: hypothetical protein ACFFAT_22145 [Promethearchaeota archaeon]
MNSTITKKPESIDYENEILDYIRENPSGVTITDIAKDMSYSRNTVSKYITALQLKDKIFNKSIGQYNLYFSVNTRFIPKGTMVLVFKAILKSLKMFLPNDGSIYKEMGKNFFLNFEYKFGESLLKEIATLKKIKEPKLHLEFFRKLFPSFNFLQDTMEITSMTFENNYRKAIYRFQNSEFINTSNYYVFYFYIIAGVAEACFMSKLNRNVSCDIVKIHISDNKEESYVDLSIEFE